MTQPSTDPETFAAYAEIYCRQHGLSPIDEEDRKRIAMLAERAILAGRSIPRQADKALEPLTEFKVLNFSSGRWE